jgi:hypothetical protein
MLSKFALALLVQQVAGQNNPCSNCGECVAQPNNPHSATDDHCQPCANDGQSWWPCNQSDLCECKTGSVTTEPTPTTAAPEVIPCTSACSSCSAIPNNPHSANDAHCAPCADGQAWWPCDNAELCQCDDSNTPDITTPEAPTEAPTQAPEAPTTETETIDNKVRKAQASVFGDYTSINWNQVMCSQDDSDAKPYMQGNPICAAAINMGSGAFQTTDQNGNPGFCKRTQPGNGAAWASSCWKVRCVGGDNAFNVGVSCAHNDWIYLKAVDTNMENSLSLTDDAYTAQCENVATNQPSCRAFDITVQAWDLIVVLASNQGALAGEPAGLNGSIPLEYEEVDCNDSVVKAAISDSHCGLPSTLLV